jgi:hypothetical protein
LRQQWHPALRQALLRQVNDTAGLRFKPWANPFIDVCARNLTTAYGFSVQ